MFTIDLTKHQLSQAINNQQRRLDNSNTHRLRDNRALIDNRALMDNRAMMDIPVERMGRNSTEHKAQMHRNLADIQKEQMKLRKIDVANDLIRNRIEDEENLLKINERFPYGKENVDISEDVLERYRGNYIEQSRMLEKFRVQAELMKKTSRVKPSNSKPFQWCNVGDAHHNRKREEELRRMRETIHKEHEEERALRELEKKNMRKIADTLSGLSAQLHNNSYTLEKGIRDLHFALKKRQRKPQVGPPKHTYKDILDIEASSQKIPVVVYRNQSFDARLYFSEVFKKAPRIVKEEKSSLQKEEYKELMKVLAENNRRIRFLDRLQKETSPAEEIANS